MEGEVLTWVAVTTILGLVLPPILALVKRFDLEEKTKDMVVLVLLVGVGGVAGFIIGDVSLAMCTGVELIVCAAKIVAAIDIVVGQAFLWYKMFWKPSGLDDRISGTA